MNENGNAIVYDLLAYIASAAKEMYIDPKVYAPLRLLSVMLRFIEIMQQEEELDQGFLYELKQKVLQNRSLLLSDSEKFMIFLDELIMFIANKNLS